MGLLTALCVPVAAQPPGRLYVADEGANALSVIDPAANAVVASIPLAGTPGIPALSTSGERIYVPLRTANQVAVVDIATNSVVNTLSHASLAEPAAVAVFAGRGEVWVVNRVGGPGGNGSVTVFDANTLAFVQHITSAGFAAPEHIAFSPTGSQAYVVNTGNGTLTQILAGNYSVNFSVAVGAVPRFAVVGQAGRFIYVANEGSSNFSIVDMFTRGVDFVPTPGSPRNMALSPGGSQLYIALQNNLVSVFDIQTQVLRNISFPTPGFVSHAVALQRGTRFGYVSNRGAGTVVSFDASTRMPLDGDGNPVAGFSAPRALLSTGVVTVSDLSLTLTAAPSAALGGETVTYSVDVFNAGPSIATETRLTFDLSAPYQLISANPGQGSCRTDEEEGLVCELGSLDYRSTTSVSIQLAILAAGTVNATFGVEAEESDPNPADNTVMASTAVTAAADLAVTITDQPDPVQVGGLLVYTVRILNRGPSTAEAVRFFDPLPFGVLLDSIDAGLGNCLASDASILCNLESIPSGQEQTVVIRVVPTVAGNLLNGVDVRSSVLDPNPSNNAAVALTMVRGGVSDMVLAKESSSPLVNPGVQFSYRLVATNLGPNAAAAIRVTDVAPAGLEFLPDSEGEPECEFEGGTLTCRADRLEAGESRVFSVPARVEAAIGEMVVNTASVSAADTDPDQTNNQASAAVRVVARGDLNGDGTLDARDVQELVLEINDGDGAAAADAAGGSHPGNATMDVNGDGLINRDDLRALTELIFG